MTSLIRNRRGGIAAAAAVLEAALALLTGCSEPVATGSRTPVTSSEGAISTSARQIDGQALGGNTAPNSRGVVRAGSFPRSFQIPGTETSIRIGGS
jgi:hypothetical protein